MDGYFAWRQRVRRVKGGDQSPSDLPHHQHHQPCLAYILTSPMLPRSSYCSTFQKKKTVKEKIPSVRGGVLAPGRKKPINQLRFALGYNLHSHRAPGTCVMTPAFNHRRRQLRSNTSSSLL